MQMTQENCAFAKFGDRAAAYILDLIIIGIFSFCFTDLNFTNSKSFLLYLPIAIIAILYKPYMESSYGATIGKKLLNLKVVDENFEKINFQQSIKRSFILILPSILYIPVYYFALQDQMVINAADPILAIPANYPVTGTISNLSLIIILIDLIVLLGKKPRFQSLHDLIAQTYVVKGPLLTPAQLN